MKINEIVKLIYAECEADTRDWEQDEPRSQDEWLESISEQLMEALGSNEASSGDYRERMLQIAACTLRAVDELDISSRPIKEEE